MITPMNILVYSAGFPPLKGGIEQFVYNACKQLADRGHRVRVIAGSTERDEEFDRHQEFSICRYKKLAMFSSFFAAYKILSLCFAEKTDMLFLGHFGSTHLFGAVLAKKILRIPYVILVHGSDLNAYLHGFTWIDRVFAKIVLKNARRIIVNSNRTKENVVRHKYPPDQVYVVNPGTDIKKFIPRNDINIIKNRLYGSDRKILLSIGRLVKRKGHDRIIKALPEVIKRVPNVLLIIVGKGSEEASLKTLARDMRLHNYVRFAGSVNEEQKISYYQSCDVFIMPSFEIRKADMNDYEGFGIVYAEANACGKPVIGGRSGGVKEAVIDGVTGILVDPDNIHEISESIIRLLIDQRYAKKLGENGRRRVEEELNWAMVGNKINRVLNNVW
jgi:phosphatidylinositol alpha-1,6-mannosyltransferase